MGKSFTRPTIMTYIIGSKLAYPENTLWGKNCLHAFSYNSAESKLIRIKSKKSVSQMMRTGPGRFLARFAQ